MKRRYSQHNYLQRNLTSPIAWSGFSLLFLMPRFLGIQGLSISMKYLCSSFFYSTFLSCFLSLIFFFFPNICHIKNFRPNANRKQISGPGHLKKLSLLRKACDLIKNFPEYYDVVVNVARKTDARHWADLFSAAGISTTYVFLSLYVVFGFLFCLS